VMDPILWFQRARTTLCLCPHCGEIVRVSDLSLRYEGVVPRTWLDKYERRDALLEEKEERFEEEEEEIREAARERGRKRARKAVSKFVSAALPGCTYHPQDIKALLHPVEYVVFCGMTEKEQVKEIVLLSRETDVPDIRNIRKSIEKAIDRGDYYWRVARVSEKGEVVIK